LIQDFPWRLVQPVHDTRRHTFSWEDPDLYKKAVNLRFQDIKAYPGRVEGKLLIVSQELGHSLPTGDYGYHEITLIISLEDEWGKVIADRLKSMFVETKDSIKPGEKRILSFDLPDPKEKGRLLRARIIKSSFDRRRKLVFSEVIYKLPSLYLSSTERMD